MNSPQISLVICTHNPKLPLLERTLAALKSQTVPATEWELLLIDNASSRDLAGLVDLSWHPHSRVLREDDLGLTPARLRGIRESKADLIVFVDDDNILDSDYLQQALEYSQQWPKIGVFGGSCRGEYEVPPPASIRPYLSSLAVWEIDREHWANTYEWSLATPNGAGMCVRRDVAAAYERRVESRPMLKKTGRRGTILTAGEDHDIVRTAIDLGYGSARFPALKLTHFITAGRLTEDYMIRLHAGFAFSAVILGAYRSISTTAPTRSWTRDLRLLIRACAHRNSLFRRMEIAKWRARQAAISFLVDADTRKMKSIEVKSAR